MKLHSKNLKPLALSMAALVLSACQSTHESVLNTPEIINPHAEVHACISKISDAAELVREQCYNLFQQDNNIDVVKDYCDEAQDYCYDAGITAFLRSYKFDQQAALLVGEFGNGGWFDDLPTDTEEQIEPNVLSDEESQEEFNILEDDRIDAIYAQQTAVEKLATGFALIADAGEQERNEILQLLAEITLDNIQQSLTVLSPWRTFIESHSDLRDMPVSVQTVSYMANLSADSKIRLSNHLSQRLKSLIQPLHNRSGLTPNELLVRYQSAARYAWLMEHNQDAQQYIYEAITLISLEGLDATYPNINEIMSEFTKDLRKHALI